MIRKIIDTEELVFMELKDIEMNGKPLKDFFCSRYPEMLAVHIKEYIKAQDTDILRRVRKNPDLYKWIIFPMNGMIYAAFFMVIVSEQVFQIVREVTAQFRNQLNLAYAYVFDSLDMIEDFIANRVVTKTDESSLYKINNKFYYMTSDELHGLSEFFITGKLMSMCVINEHGDVIISDDAYGKICSYLYRPDNNQKL